MLNNAMSVVILAAGKGTRMYSDLPKVLHTLAGKAMVQHVIDAANELGAAHVHLVYGHGGDLLKQALKDDNLNWVLQAEQLGTGHAMQQAAPFFADDEDILMLYGDVPLISVETLQRLRDAKPQGGIGLLTVKLDDPTGYGRITRENGKVTGIVEHKDATDEQRQIQEINTGILIANGADMKRWLAKLTNNNAQGEYYLTDVLGIARNQGKRVLGLKAEDASECLGVNSRRQLAEATKVLQQRINGMHMDNGVAIMDPATTWIGPDVTIEPDVEILPMTFLMGATSIATGSVVGPNSRLTDTTVGANCQVEETVAIETVLDADVTCGPRAYLRPGTHMCEGSKAGTHVEIKKSTIGKGSKVPHLSYIGDTTMGEGVNIGAGSITCNYDGEKKWPTTIGDNCFVGSDVMMVAPVTLGENSLIGAGSVITKDVSAGALGLGRARQTEIEHWNERKKN